MTRAEVLEKAKACVCGQREQDYGSPEDNFQTIADLWSAYKGDTTFTSADVAMMMALMKIARIKTGTATDDSFVDLAGYAACGGEIGSTKNQFSFAFENFDDAEEAAANISSLIREEGVATVFDVKNIVRKITHSTKNNMQCHVSYSSDDALGWTSMKGIYSHLINDCQWVLVMPVAKNVTKEKER